MMRKLNLNRGQRLAIAELLIYLILLGTIIILVFLVS